VPYLELGGGRNVLSCIPETGSGRSRTDVGNGGDEEYAPAQEVVDLFKLTAHSANALFREVGAKIEKYAIPAS